GARRLEVNLKVTSAFSDELEKQLKSQDVPVTAHKIILPMYTAQPDGILQRSDQPQYESLGRTFKLTAGDTQLTFNRANSTGPTKVSNNALHNTAVFTLPADATPDQ